MLRSDELVVETVGTLRVVRDDLYPGGTKARVLPAFLDAIDAGETCVYAGPAYGYAQVALAHACAATGRRAVVWVAERKRWHPRTAEAATAGATIREVRPGYLAVVRARARDDAARTGATLLPFGFDHPLFVAMLARVAGTLPPPPEVWSVAGSGTLTRALQRAWPAARFHAVRIGKTPDAGRAAVHRAPEPFAADARYRPPFPSCSNYDAKAWRFVSAHARPDALFWNVAR